MICYFKTNAARKRSYDFGNLLKLFNKVKSCDMNLKQAKGLQNMFKSNLNEIQRVGVNQKS